MKLSSGFALTSLSITATAALQTGHVFLKDPVGHRQKDTIAAPLQSVSPETARLIFAQRLGISQFHSIDNPNDEVIQQLNAYGAKQHMLFGVEKQEAVERTKSRVLVWIEGVENVEAIIPDPSIYSATFSIDNPPAQEDNDDLIEAFASQAQSLPEKVGFDGPLHLENVFLHAAFKSFKAVDTQHENLNVFRATQNDKLSNAELKRALANLLDMRSDSKEGPSITVVVLPPASAKSKRSVNPYGNYKMPFARRQQTEKLLSPSTSQPSESAAPLPADLEDFPTVSVAKTGSKVLGILPSCFQTKEACEKQTNNCSSHGECSLKKKGAADTRTDCYTCECVPTVEMVGGGGMEEKPKTTYWGGPACQKKDISIPFWLFVSTGVILAFLISTGIGMLYSMGSEELPSVIGAGVSGPVRK